MNKLPFAILPIVIFTLICSQAQGLEKAEKVQNSLETDIIDLQILLNDYQQKQKKKIRNLKIGLILITTAIVIETIIIIVKD